MLKWSLLGLTLLAFPLRLEAEGSVPALAEHYQVADLESEAQVRKPLRSQEQPLEESAKRGEDEQLDLTEIMRALEADGAEISSSRSSAVTAGKSNRSWTDALNPEISLIGDFALAWFGTGTPNSSGAHDPRGTGFSLQGLELAIRQNLDPYFRFDANILFSDHGVEVEEAYASTLALPFGLQGRFGQFLTSFGRFNRQHLHQWSFLDQMLVYGDFFGPENNGGLGVEASILLPIPWYVEAIASVTHAASADHEEQHREHEEHSELLVEEHTRRLRDFQYTFALKQFFPLGDDWSLSWGGSAALMPSGAQGEQRSDVYGTDVYLRWRPVSRAADWMFVALQAEYLHRVRKLSSHTRHDQGAYGYLLWRFAQRWEAGLRQDWTLGGKHGDFEFMPSDAGKTARRRTSLQTTFFPTEFSRFRAQVNYDRLQHGKTGWGFFLGAEVAVGAHGAHEF